MRIPNLLNLIAFVILSTSLSLLPAQDADVDAPAGQTPADLLADLPWRSIGPASFGGRIADVEAVASDPSTIFVAAASGGIFRSRNHGVTWEPVFDQAARMLSVGDLAIAPSDPNVVWAGTGEPNNRQSSPWGHGVYRSLDGGNSWRLMGLERTHHIGRIVIDPTDPETVFVAALGRLWGPNPERGLYRTQDGGRSWEKVLEINPDTGVVDVAVEAGGRILYAAAYQRRRRGWGFVGGGPHGGVYRSLDGGDHWERLSQGLPQGDVGRIGLAIAPSRPNRVYAVVEHKEGGIFRSDDRGASWEKVNSLNPRPMYYSQIRVDPVNPNKIWVLGSPLYVSIDGGKTFTSDGTAEKIHVDHHALWINPNQPDHLILGNDGGLYISYDGGSNWDFIDNLPIAQYYAIGVDQRDPYWVYGGTQDNGTWALPSRTYSRLGITNADVVNIAYGDGFYAAVHPEDHTLVFAESQNGRLYFVDMDTMEERGIRPVPEDPREEGDEEGDEEEEGETYRFNWSSPLLLSVHDPQVIYYGGNKLFRSSDRGQTWTEISPDLTGDPKWKELPVMGVTRDEDTLSRDDGIAHYGTLTTISESPIDPGLMLTGSDDGRVHMTRDGGQTWTDLTARFTLPGPRWVSRAVASRHGVNRAYVAFDGHYDDDFSPYLFRTEDGGETWTNLGAGLPEDTVVNAVAEHPVQPEIVFAGTEWGLFVTLDGGVEWIRIEGGLPPVPIDDIIYQERGQDLVLGTHGRGIWIWDDVGVLNSLTEAHSGDRPHLFEIESAVQFYEERALPAPGASEFAGPNPPYGARITYYLPRDLEAEDSDEETAAADEDTVQAEEEDEVEKEESESPTPSATVEIRDADGELVRSLQGPGRAGIHRVVWDLRYPLSFEAEDEEGWFGPVKGPFVLPGNYQAVLVAGGESRRRSFDVRIDPAASTSPDQLEERLAASRRTEELLAFFVKAAERVEKLAQELDRLEEDLEDQPEQSELLKSVKAAKEGLEKSSEDFESGWRSDKGKIIDLLGQLQASTRRPTQAQLRTLEHLVEIVGKKVVRFNQQRDEHLRPLEAKLQEAGMPTLAGEPMNPPEPR